jgi:N6-L-threonylcarbamoyladenine synthase
VSGREPLLLAIESSCDETGVALVAGGRRIVAQAVASQIALHAPAGGIVPELAARAHLRWIVPALREVLETGGVTLPQVDGIAVTAGPGLAGSLLVGIAFAKTLAWAHRLPLVGVNHLEGHLYAAWLLGRDEPERPAPPFPLVALVVSGGHTFLVEMRDHLSYRLLGETVDDAAGEAFDKAGRLLGLGYPGGPAIATAAVGARRRDTVLPRAWLGGSYDFSFSGLKTALRRLVEAELAAAARPPTESGGRLDPPRVAELAWGFQEAVVDVLSTKTLRAADDTAAQAIVLGGGVASNRALRERIAAGAAARGLPVFIPPPDLCTDNGAMIGAAGWQRFLAGERAGSDLGARPAWPLVRPFGTPDTRRPPRRGPAARAYEAALAAERDAAGDVPVAPVRGSAP